MSATPEREQAKALIERGASVGHWFTGTLIHPNREHDPECPRCIIDSLAAAVSRLEAERDDFRRYLHRATAQRLNIEGEYNISERRALAAEAQVAALVGRERELTQALDRLIVVAARYRDTELRGDLEDEIERAREALAGGGRTPPGYTIELEGDVNERWSHVFPDSERVFRIRLDGTDSGGLGLSAEPVAEALADLRTFIEDTRAMVADHWSGCVPERLKAIEAAPRIDAQIFTEDLHPPDPPLGPRDPDWLSVIEAALSTAAVPPPESVSPGAADVAEAGE